LNECEGRGVWDSRTQKTFQALHTSIEREKIKAAHYSSSCCTAAAMYSGYGAGVDDLRAPSSSARGGGHGGVDDVAKRVKDPLLKTADWVKTRSPKEKSILAGAAAVFVRFWGCHLRVRA
jgi:hypothetical protein